jgi:hypothetical protein
MSCPSSLMTSSTASARMDAVMGKHPKGAMKPDGVRMGGGN